MDRRNFIKQGLVTSTGVVYATSAYSSIFPRIINDNPEDINQLYQGFVTPPISSKPFVRWWWNGNRLDGKEILRELDVMKNAGIGGVEINPIAFPGRTDPAGYNSLTIFEDDWLNMLQTALKGAKERGIICDMIVGSGWPFGGEFLKKEEQSQMVTIGVIDLEGNRVHKFSISDLLDKVNPEIHSKNKNVYKDLVIARLAPAEANIFTPGTDVPLQPGNNEILIDVPPGNHVLYYVVKLTGYMAVINGAPGAAGPVLNHYSQPATQAYLDRVSGYLNKVTGDNMGSYIRAMFCDSMELEGANWSDDLPDEFEKRRGYSLWPYLPFVLKKVGHMGNPLEEKYGTNFPSAVSDNLKRVELDFYKTRIELFKERFIDTFNVWCHTNNVQSRMQAYGRGMHPLEASMEIDIPECETWLFKDVGRKYPDTGLSGRAPRMCNKYVSSAAALAGRKIVSCEEITNTSMVFMASLENIKIAGDQSNISGVNQSILHGFNYSPPDAPFPGWIRYGTYFNEQNTWWPFFRNWSDYKSRLSYIFQNSTPQANIAILQPLNDLWLKYGPQRDPFPQKWYPDYQNNIWEVIHQNGGGCDYVSENIINHAEFGDGKMNYNQRSYTALLLPEIETINVETARSIASFAEKGGKIVFIGKTPYKSPSFLNNKTEDKRVAEIINELVVNDRIIQYPPPNGDVIQWYKKMQNDLGLQPYVKFNNPHRYISQSTYRHGNNWLLFIANTGLNEDISLEAEFMVNNNMVPWIWNPETGERKRFPATYNTNKLLLHIPRATSMLIVFEENKEGEILQSIPKVNGPNKMIDGPWHLQLNHINGEKGELEIEELGNLLDIEKTKSFAGEVIYEKSIQVSSNDFRYLDLGNVQGISSLWVNDHFIGTKWYGAHTYDVNNLLLKGENTLKVKLTTIIGNYVKSLEDNPVAQRWTGRQEYYPMGVMGPVVVY